MKRINSLRLSGVLCFALVIGTGCNPGIPTLAVPPPTAVALAATATAVPAVPTDTPVPPTATPTQVPATATSSPTVAPSTTPTPVPATATAVPPTLTPRPTLRPTAVPKLLVVDWKTGVEYIPRDGSSNWCQMHDQYHNNSAGDIAFQEAKTLVFPGQTPPNTYSGYGPIFGVANPDGTIKQWSVAGWYSKLFGWPNGIPGFPAPIPAGTLSDDWTWYSFVQTNGEYCRYVYVKWGGQVSAAEYSPKGDLTNANATLPAGAP